MRWAERRAGSPSGFLYAGRWVRIQLPSPEASPCTGYSPPFASKCAFNASYRASHHKSPLLFVLPVNVVRVAQRNIATRISSAASGTILKPCTSLVRLPAFKKSSISRFSSSIGAASLPTPVSDRSSTRLGIFLADRMPFVFPRLPESPGPHNAPITRMSCGPNPAMASVIFRARA